MTTYLLADLRRMLITFLCVRNNAGCGGAQMSDMTLSYMRLSYLVNTREMWFVPEGLRREALMGNCDATLPLFGH